MPKPAEFARLIDILEVLLIHVTTSTRQMCPSLRLNKTFLSPRFLAAGVEENTCAGSYVSKMQQWHKKSD